MVHRRGEREREMRREGRWVCVLGVLRE